MRFYKMRSNTIRALTLLTATAATVAAESTVSLFLPYADRQSLVAEVVGSSDSATTYVVNCASAGEDCPMPSSGYTIVQGPSTVKEGYSDADYYAGFDCKLGGTTSFSCLVSQVDNSTTQTSATVMTTDIGSFFLPVVVTGTATAGAHATTGASVTAGTASATGKTTLATSGPSATSGAQATGSSASASTSHSSSGNAAMPQIAGNANWAIGGAAMAMALALA